MSWLQINSFPSDSVDGIWLSDDLRWPVCLVCCLDCLVRSQHSLECWDEVVPENLPFWVCLTFEHFQMLEQTITASSESIFLVRKKGNLSLSLELTLQFWKWSCTDFHNSSGSNGGWTREGTSSATSSMMPDVPGTFVCEDEEIAEHFCGRRLFDFACPTVVAERQSIAEGNFFISGRYKPFHYF